MIRINAYTFTDMMYQHVSQYVIQYLHHPWIHMPNKMVVIYPTATDMEINMWPAEGSGEKQEKIKHNKN
jgi:hypothetical protein